MIVDSSAVVAILRGEPEADEFGRIIGGEHSPRISAVNYVETCVVIDNAGNPLATRKLESFLREAHVSIEPVSVEQAKIARQAYRDFGKGSGHPAKLNFGDCFAYALATETGEPLLYKGDDFSHTDIAAAQPE